MVLHAAYKIDRGENFRSEISTAKHFVASSLNRIIDRAMQGHGALGYWLETPVLSLVEGPLATMAQHHPGRAPQLLT